MRCCLTLAAWFLRKLEKHDKAARQIYGARIYANQLRSRDPRVARELDAAIDRHELERDLGNTAV